MEFSRRHQADFAHHFRAGDGRFQDQSASGADLLADRQRGHSGAAAGMDDGFFQRIVVIQTVRQSTVGEHRIGGRNLGS
jgi:hypothetical protein